MQDGVCFTELQVLELPLQHRIPHAKKMIRAKKAVVNPYRNSGGNCRPYLSLS